MKYRTGFVTNSSSSSNVIMKIKSKPFAEFMKKAAEENRYIEAYVTIKNDEIEFNADELSIDEVGCVKSEKEIIPMLSEILYQISFDNVNLPNDKSMIDSIEYASYECVHSNWGEFADDDGNDFNIEGNFEYQKGKKVKYSTSKTMI
ncbi:MAG: hypothetical protein IKL68_00950 [Clostridia bacterium]|nr:hypothetical protein [Clostridia bacterium]